MNQKNTTSATPGTGLTTALRPSVANWVRSQRQPKRKKRDAASSLQLGAINLASNYHA